MQGPPAASRGPGGPYPSPASWLTSGGRTHKTPAAARTSPRTTRCHAVHPSRAAQTSARDRSTSPRRSRRPPAGTSLGKCTQKLQTPASAICILLSIGRRPPQRASIRRRCRRPPRDPPGAPLCPTPAAEGRDAHTRPRSGPPARSTRPRIARQSRAGRAWSAGPTAAASSSARATTQKGVRGSAGLLFRARWEVWAPSGGYFCAAGGVVCASEEGAYGIAPRVLTGSCLGGASRAVSVRGG